MPLVFRSAAVSGALLLAVCASSRAGGATAPADPCALLPAAAVSQAAGAAYGAAQASVAPRPFANTAQGTDCHYNAPGGKGQLLFRIYFDSSAGEATALFARLKMFYGTPTPVSGVGDEAYFDQQGALHARKGNVRYYLQMGENKEAPLKAMASLVAGKL